MESGNRRCFCVTVHGTFARDATWIGPSSPFCSALSRLSGAEIVPFRWSGGNSDGDRVAAALTLREAIAGLAAEHPEARIALVGHSHGGNIIRYALQGDLGQRVELCVFLGTPFINLEPRNLHAMNRVFRVLTPLASILVALACVSLMGALGKANIENGLNAKDVGFALRWLLTLVLVLLSGLTACAGLLATPALKRRQRALAGQLCPPGFSRRADLVLFTRADEAAGAIRLADLAANGFARSARHFSRVSIAALRVHRRLVWFLPFAVLSGSPIVQSVPYSFAFAAPLGLVGSVYLASLATTMCCTLLMPLLLLAGYLCALPVRAVTYGWNGFLSYFLFTTIVSRVPLRAEARTATVARLLLQRARLSLAHSAFYDDPEVQKIVGHALAGEVYKSPIILQRPTWRGRRNRPLPRVWSRYLLPVIFYGPVAVALLTLFSVEIFGPLFMRLMF